MTSAQAEGASKSLNKTITEIMSHMNDSGDRPSDGLRGFLYEKIGDLAERWYKKGFNRGHIESYRKFQQLKQVPTTLEYQCRRNLCPRQERGIELKSKIRSTTKKPKASSRKKGR